MPTYAESTSMNTPVVQNTEGIWGELIVQDVREVVFRRPLPVQLIETYAEAAVRHANVRKLDDGEWFAEIEHFPGVWAKKASPKGALEELEEVVFEWVLLKIGDEDRDIPVIESLDLNTL